MNQHVHIDIEFEKIKRIEEDPWPIDYLKKPVPGNLYMIPGTIGLTGGLLCLNKQGEYISLTSRQIFCEEKIDWPDKLANIYLKIVGDEIKIFNLR